MACPECACSMTELHPEIVCDDYECGYTIPLKVVYCPEGVHSIFDFCPGNCLNEDE